MSGAEEGVGVGLEWEDNVILQGQCGYCEETA